MSTRQRKPPRPTSPDDKITLGEAGHLIRVTPETMRRYIRQGKLTGYRLAGGKSVRVRRGDVEALTTPMVTVGTVDDPLGP